MSVFDERESVPIFRDRDVLKEEWHPPEILRRKDEKQELVMALTPVVEGHTPDNILITGPNGSGKSATVRWVLDELRETEDMDTDLTIEYVNCDPISTGYRLSITLANRFLDHGEKLSRSGYSEEDVHEEMLAAMEETGGTILLVLDEVGTVRDLDGLFYTLSRAESRPDGLDEATVGFCGITTDGEVTTDLRPDVRSTLALNSIEFGSYDAKDLREILRYHADRAFQDERIEEGVVSFAAAHAAQNGGDARMGIDLLRIAGDLAKADESESVSTDHMEEALDRYERDHVLSVISKINETAKFATYAMLSLVAERDEEPRTKEIYKRYKVSKREIDGNTVSLRRFRDVMDRLQQVGLVQSEKKQGSEGQYRIHALRDPFTVEETLDRLEDVRKKTILFDSLREYVDK